MSGPNLVWLLDSALPLRGGYRRGWAVAAALAVPVLLLALVIGLTVAMLFG